MKRTFTSYPVSDFVSLKAKMLNWLSRFSIFCLLDNQQYNFDVPTFECLAGAGVHTKFNISSNKNLENLQHFLAENNDWIFGHLNYDIKNEIENLSSDNTDNINFPDLYFFIPEMVLILDEKFLQVGVLNENADDIFKSINDCTWQDQNKITNPPQLKSRFSKEEYIATVKHLQQHLHRGDCYEINFCQEFFAENIFIDPLLVYNQLIKLSPNPFSCFYKIDDKYLMCASPERYLKRINNKIISQPIKGTSKRFIHEKVNDDLSKNELLTNEKERAENVMIVDLVRNDLSKICEEGSVNVDELFGIYSFPQVHQMISTISGKLLPDVDFIDIIKATFPMGSMTGAPKKRVMELIEQYEKSRRGIFSGCVGYISPDKNFDFNVVIRSLLYNTANKYISIYAGSAITCKSDPEKEYEECLMKIEAMKKAME